MKSDVKLIETILDGIYYEMTGELRANEKGFNQADIFVDLYFKENFAEIIFNSLKNDTDLAKIAALLDILVWSTPDNGTKLEKLIYDWIISDNKIKVQIILLRQDSFPRTERVENIKVLENVKQIFLELTELCNYHIDEFDYQKKTGLRRLELLHHIRENRKI